MHSTLLEIDQTEKELQSGKANWKGDVDGIRDVVVEVRTDKSGRAKRGGSKHGWAER